MYLTMSVALSTTSFAHCCSLQSFNNKFKDNAPHTLANIRVVTPANIASPITLGQYFWVPSSTISFDLGIVDILGATDGVDRTKDHVINRINLNDIHQRLVDNVLSSVRTNNVAIFVDG